MSNEAACAHLKVEYRRVDNDNKTCSDSWRCLSCGQYFWPGVKRPQSVQQAVSDALRAPRELIEKIWKLHRYRNLIAKKVRPATVWIHEDDIRRLLREHGIEATGFSPQDEVQGNYELKFVEAALSPEPPAIDLSEYRSARRTLADKANEDENGPIAEPGAAQPNDPFRSDEWFRGFEAAHELMECGHSRGDLRDPNYQPGMLITNCRCVGCEKLAEVRGLALRQAADAVQNALTDERIKELNGGQFVTAFSHVAVPFAVRAILAIDPSAERAGRESAGKPPEKVVGK